GLGSTDRPSLVASSNTSDYSQSDRGTVRDLAKESKDKETQLANVISYPKFGGAAPTEESSKPVIQQQKPQSFQSSLARDSAPEKVHPLSESFVSGRILSQPNLSQPNKESQADFKSGDSKTTTAKAADAKITDGKSADVKADAKPSDFKTTDARLPEGRAADPRSLDASHLATSPTAKVGEAHGLHPTVTQPGQALPTDKVILAAANPATAGKTDNQPTGKGDGSTKLDAAHTDTSIPDKSGKKPDGVDDKKETTATAKGPGSAADTGKIPGGKSFNDLLDFIDKADQGADIKPGGKANVPLGGSNILSPDDVLITGTAAVGQAGFPGTTEETSNDESDSDKLSHRRKKYIVQPGDTLDSIAKAELGDERFSSLILTINQANIPSKEENGKSIAIKLQLGQILWLPSDHELQVYTDLYLLD
ncbi:MAG: LysM peptidoglycan-binding domain-containing protein, partial [Candidatus Obscuribacterales bacterium]|nr:LysM peptidoglycan-binding domain-containing protein [Candidatus Obscuribacterales bacterium]